MIDEKRIEQSILLLRGYKVILSNELARLYEVEHRQLIQAVKRNIERFPNDFMFQLTEKEVECSRSQIVILNRGRGSNIKYNPYAFTHSIRNLIEPTSRKKNKIGFDTKE